MIQKLIILLLVYSETFSCLQMYANIYASEKSDIKRAPWMVKISRQFKPTDDIDGSLIHERAVLSHMKMNFDKLHFVDIQVFAGCYNNLESTLNDYCDEVRQIREYHTMEYTTNSYKDIIVLLILTEPFTLSETINTISFAPSYEDYDINNCIIMSFEYKINLLNGSQIEGKWVYPIYTQLTFYEPSISDINNLTTTGFISRILFVLIVDWTGSPLVCKSKRDTDRWLLVGAVHFKRTPDINLSPAITAIIKRLDFNEIQMTLNEIIKDNMYSSIKH